MQKLSEFLKLSDAELALQGKIMNAAVKHGSPESFSKLDIVDQELEELIYTADLSQIVKLTLVNPAINKLCSGPCFTKLWTEVWHQWGKACGNQDFVSVPTISDYDQVKGFYIYQAYLKGLKEEEPSLEFIKTAEEYLTRSSDHGCYFAMNALCTHGLTFLKSLAQPEEIREAGDKVMKYAEKAADLHWTPGYMLLSNVFQELSLYVKALYPGDPIVSKEQHYLRALNALWVAQKLEPYSKDMVSNAYLGKTIWEATYGQVKTWFAARVRLQGLSNGIIRENDVSEQERKAKSTCNEICKKYKLSENPAKAMDEEQKDQTLSKDWDLDTPGY
jgi:hypothetical protein